MKYHKYIVALAFAIGIALGLLTSYHSDDTQSFKQTKDQVKQLQYHADSLEQVNDLLDAKYLVTRKQADSLKQALEENNNHYTQLKQHKHETITHITNLTTDGIYKFFSDFNAEDPAGK